MTRSALARAAIAVLSIACATGASAQLYRWTDAQGRVQMSDKPPPAGTPGVTSTDPAQHRADPKAQAEALRRAQEERQLLREYEQKRQQATAPGAPSSAASAPAAGASAALAAASKPAAPRGETQCARRQREFRQSQECFAPFRLAGGGLRPEAMEKCGAPAPDPGECR